MRVKTDEKRKEILEVAMEVFQERGYAEASMSVISARLGGSKGTLYGYFKSKEELFVSAMVEMARHNASPLVDELERAGDIQAGLVRFMHKVVQLLCSPDVVNFRRMLLSEGGRSNLGKLAYEQGTKQYLQRFAELYGVQMRQGHFREMDPWLAANHLHSLCSGGFALLVLEGAIERPSDEELAAAAQAAADLFLSAHAVDYHATAPRKRSVRPKRKYPSRSSR